MPNRATCRKHFHCSGFTVVELLTVVAMLLVAIAALMPALAKAQRQARTAACLSNLRQIHQGYETYLRQNHDRSFDYDPTYASLWTHALGPYMAEGSEGWLCPEADAPSYGWGSARSAWGPFDSRHSTPTWMAFMGAASSSYGFNSWLYSHPGMRGGRHFRRSDPYHIPVFVDSNWIDGAPECADVAPTDLNAGAGPNEPELGRFCLARHGRSVNIVFVDGHAEQCPLESLWRLRWSSTFMDTSPPANPVPAN